MKWKKTKNPDVIDQRGASGGGGGGMGGLPIPSAGKSAGGLGIVGIIVFILITVLGGSGSGGGFEIPSGLPTNVQAPGEDQGLPPGEDPQVELKDFSTAVFTDVQQVWKQIYAQAGEPYEKAQMVLYSEGVNTGCGSATSAVGPFYCPADDRVYLDLTFYDAMTQQLQAPGDFAWAYVIAHEMGHHIQDLDGSSDKVQSESQSNPDDANELSVRLELQADCYSGVWAKTVFAKGDLEEGDIEEAQTAAAAVGDDRLQSRGGGNIDPDSFTHGTSEQRRHWFDTGYETGEPADCDTFSPDSV